MSVVKIIKDPSSNRVDIFCAQVGRTLCTGSSLDMNWDERSSVPLVFGDDFIRMHFVDENCGADLSTLYLEYGGEKIRGEKALRIMDDIVTGLWLDDRLRIAKDYVDARLMGMRLRIKVRL